MSTKAIDFLPGFKKEDLTVLEIGKNFISTVSGKQLKGRSIKCICVCGEIFTTTVSHFNLGNSKSCWKCTVIKRAKSKAKGQNWSWYAYLVARHNKKHLKDGDCITYDEWADITTKSCAYCGLPPVYKEHKRKVKHWKANGMSHHGVDRVDNLVGYIKTNCVSCCELCNKMKRDLTVGDFKIHLQRISDHLLKGF